MTLQIKDLEFFKKNALFHSLSDSELWQVLSIVKEKVYEPSEFIIDEDDSLNQEMYLIKSGSVEILKKSPEQGDDTLYPIVELSANEIIGEIALLENVQRTAYARAAQKTRVYAISVPELKALKNNGLDKKNGVPIYLKLTENLGKILRSRLENTNLISAERLQKKLKLSQMRVALGRFVISLLSLMALYAFGLSALSSFSHSLPSTTILAVPMMVIFFVVLMRLILMSGYPIKVYGLTLKNWKRSAIQGVIWSIPIMLLIVVFKWSLIKLFHIDLPVFEGPSGAMNVRSPLYILPVILAYLIMTPMQEILVRGAIQGSLQLFLTGKYKILWAIISSNLIFGMSHLHLSLPIAVSVVILGLFWGYMYYRQGNVVGVSVSHMIIGIWGFFIIGFKNLMLF